ncbi:hypothetical protein SCHPADRAFT_947151 [Schizopora paradoxa]|uniref:JmjC domain-containing protein n=1 Tax=Schizopora paradoxa TaxID=27342 RepID=A0A0H2R0B4_9AGAM|nr:hypothetical protein SCHPADRAFT_947151 [Schizopora paradoxa]
MSPSSSSTEASTEASYQLFISTLTQLKDTSTNITSDSRHASNDDQRVFFLTSTASHIHWYCPSNDWNPQGQGKPALTPSYSEQHTSYPTIATNLRGRVDKFDHELFANMLRAPGERYMSKAAFSGETQPGPGPLAWFHGIQQAVVFDRILWATSVYEAGTDLRPAQRPHGTLDGTTTSIQDVNKIRSAYLSWDNTVREFVRQWGQSTSKNIMSTPGDIPPGSNSYPVNNDANNDDAIGSLYQAGNKADANRHISTVECNFCWAAIGIRLLNHENPNISSLSTLLSDIVHDVDVRKLSDFDILKPLYMAATFTPLVLLGRNLCTHTGSRRISLSALSQLCLTLPQLSNDPIRARVESDCWRIIVDMAFSGHGRYHAIMGNHILAWEAILPSPPSPPSTKFPCQFDVEEWDRTWKHTQAPSVLDKVSIELKDFVMQTSFTPSPSWLSEATETCWPVRLVQNITRQHFQITNKAPSRESQFPGAWSSPAPAPRNTTARVTQTPAQHPSQVSRTSPHAMQAPFAIVLPDPNLQTPPNNTTPEFAEETPACFEMETAELNASDHLGDHGDNDSSPELDSHSSTETPIPLALRRSTRRPVPSVGEASKSVIKPQTALSTRARVKQRHRPVHTIRRAPKRVKFAEEIDGAILEEEEEIDAEETTLFDDEVIKEVYHLRFLPQGNGHLERVRSLDMNIMCPVARPESDRIAWISEQLTAVEWKGLEHDFGILCDLLTRLSDPVPSILRSHIGVLTIPRMAWSRYSAKEKQSLLSLSNVHVVSLRSCPLREGGDTCMNFDKNGKHLCRVFDEHVHPILTGVTDWDSESLSLWLDLDDLRPVHDLTGESDGDNPNVRMHKASLDDFLKERTDRQHVSMPVGDLDDVSRFFSRDDPEFTFKTPWNRHPYAWALAAHGSAVSTTHIDPAGFLTHIRVILGMKIWFVATNAVTPLPRASGFHESDFSWEAVVLRPDDDFYMHPGVPHFVISLNDCLAVGGHFFSSALFSKSLRAIVVEHYFGKDITNTEHLSSGLAFFKATAGYLSLCKLHKTQRPYALPEWHQLASLLVLVIHLDQLDPLLPECSEDLVNPSATWHSTEYFAHDHRIAYWLAIQLGVEVYCAELCVALDKAEADFAELVAKCDQVLENTDRTINIVSVRETIAFHRPSQTGENQQTP